MEKYRLKAGSEIRFEIEAENEKVTIKLISGSAEMFGTELNTCKPYEFSYGTKAAIFTYHGCVITASGNLDAYIAEKTSMHEYLQTHANLEKLRHQAKGNKSRGPVVMIVGGTDVGKSTISKILLNYAVRSGWNPVYVNIDPGQGSSVSVPGTISASIVDRTAPVGHDFCGDGASLVYHYGHISPTDNYEHFKIIISELAKTTLRVLDSDGNNASGIIIDTYRNSQSTAFFNLVHAAKEFEVGTICVIGGERLASNLQRKLPPSVKIVNLGQSRGVVEKSEASRIESRRIQIRDYFYGGYIPLYPHALVLKWSDLKICKIGVPALPESCLPIGMDISRYETKIFPVTPGPNLLYHLLGVSFGKISEKDLLQANIAGFVCVSDVDVAKETITVLSPQPNIIPNATYLMSEIQFID